VRFHDIEECRIDYGLVKNFERSHGIGRGRRTYD
jgi:hypothetical protein